MDTIEKKYVSFYLPKEVAEKLEGLQSDKQIENTVIEYFNESKRELKNQLEYLDEDVLLYKSMMLKARQAFREAKEAELSANYELWEEYDKDIKGVSAYVSKAIEQLRPLKQELAEVKSLMQQCNAWDIKDLLQTIESIQHAMHGESGKMIKFLFDNYKK